MNLRNILICSLLMLCASLACPAQEWLGNYTMYPQEHASYTRAPRGYKPVYVSYYGRHGARYALKGQYRTVRKVLKDAAAQDNLTERGMQLNEGFTALYDTAASHAGLLSDPGREQIRMIARDFRHTWRRVFRGMTRAEGYATVYPRVMETMEIFVRTLDESDRTFECPTLSDTANYPFLYPASSICKERILVEVPEETSRQAEEYGLSVLDPVAWCARILKDPAVLSEQEALDLMQSLRMMVIDMPCLGYDLDAFGIKSIFDEGDLQKLHELHDLEDYLWLGPCPATDGAWAVPPRAVLDSLFARAERDMAAGRRLSLCFTHDTALMPLASLLGVGTMEDEVADFAEVASHWSSANIPMGCNFQFGFYRNRRGAILVKVLHNGNELCFPELEGGPYYRPEDLKLLWIPES